MPVLAEPVYRLPSNTDALCDRCGVRARVEWTKCPSDVAGRPLGRVLRLTFCLHHHAMIQRALNEDGWHPHS